MIYTLLGYYRRGKCEDFTRFLQNWKWPSKRQMFLKLCKLGSPYGVCATVDLTIDQMYVYCIIPVCSHQGRRLGSGRQRPKLQSMYENATVKPLLCILVLKTKRLKQPTQSIRGPSNPPGRASETQVACPEECQGSKQPAQEIIRGPSDHQKQQATTRRQQQWLPEAIISTSSRKEHLFPSQYPLPFSIWDTLLQQWPQESHPSLYLEKKLQNHGTVVMVSVLPSSCSR